MFYKGELVLSLAFTSFIGDLKYHLEAFDFCPNRYRIIFFPLTVKKIEHWFKGGAFLETKQHLPKAAYY